MSFSCSVIFQGKEQKGKAEKQKRRQGAGKRMDGNKQEKSGENGEKRDAHRHISTAPAINLTGNKRHPDPQNEPKQKLLLTCPQKSAGRMSLIRHVPPAGKPR